MRYQDDFDYAGPVVACKLYTLGSPVLLDSTSFVTILVRHDWATVKALVIGRTSLVLMPVTTTVTVPAGS